jgi:hypothetical protein
MRKRKPRNIESIRRLMREDLILQEERILKSMTGKKREAPREAPPLDGSRAGRAVCLSRLAKGSPRVLHCVHVQLDTLHSRQGSYYHHLTQCLTLT